MDMDMDTGGGRFPARRAVQPPYPQCYGRTGFAAATCYYGPVWMKK
jgi:hypothetical protein